MKFAAALSLFFSVASASSLSGKSSAKNDYVQKLMRGAVPTANSQLRRLDEAVVEEEEFVFDISSYFVKFDQCQFVKSYSDDLAQDADTDTVLYTSRFVLFRLCPNECSTCSSGYGEYLIDLDSYLDATVQYFKEEQEGMCNACQQQCYQEANEDQAAEGEDAATEEEGGRKLYSVDCTSCYEECQKIANMEANRYIDATEFLGCQMVFAPADDQKQALYAGPICASAGSKIKIGVFSDANCYFLDSSKEVDDYLMSDENLSMKLSHALLKLTYTDTCISCLEQPDENGEQKNENDQNDGDNVIELCETLYDTSAKCETSHEFPNGYKSGVEGYENQLAAESSVCDFVKSLKAGTYDESGEIYVSGSSSYASRRGTTGGQKFALTFFILGTLGLAVYAAMLHGKLVKGGKTSLLSGDSAMA